MKQIHRLFALLLSSALCFSGCGRQSQPAPEESPAAVATSEPEKSSSPATVAPQKSPSQPSVVTNYESSVVGFYFDTVIVLKAYCKKEVLQEALDLCKGFEARLSKTVEGSDVWNINHANGQPVEISDETLKVLSMALKICDLTKGAFDITIAPVVGLWDFTSGAAMLPDGAAIKEKLKLVDYTKMQLDGNTVSLPAGMSIDLGGIAKGFIADELAAFLREKGVKSGMIDLGGNIMVIGMTDDGDAWRIGIQDPDQSRGAYITVVTVSDATVVTSGIYERGFDLDGVRYHHILDTSTGWPIQNGLSSVSIIAGSSMLADALSTSCFALGLENGMALAEAFDEVEAVFVTTDRDIYYSTGLQ